MAERVVYLNGEYVAEKDARVDGRPGPIVGKLLQAWNQLIGVDIVEQAARHAR
jgi:hypothetical protein